MSNLDIRLVEQDSPEPQGTPWLSNFIEIYQRLSGGKLHLLSELYHQDIVFIDPMHQLTGLEELNLYFSKLFQQLTHCQFKIEHVISQSTEATVYWTMSYQHPRLNSGKMVDVQGCSHIKGCGDKVIFHRDYLDLGAMLYEQLPLLGRIITWFKKRAVK